MWCIVVGTYSYRTVAGVVGPFGTKEEADEFRVSKNFGPNGAKVFEVVRLPELEKKQRD